MGPGTGRGVGPRATPADTLRALAGDISEYLGPDALAAIARGLVEDAPGWEYADVLPRAVNRETGERSWAVPGMARDVAKGLWELMQGPYMEPGQNLSPEAVLSLPALAVPAGAALAPRGAIGMFAGRNAKTADLAALQRAEDMAAGGADNEAIRAATGWFKGPDEKWRFEIPDNEAVAKRTDKFEGALGDLIDHPQLFNAYPDLPQMHATQGEILGSNGMYGKLADGRESIATGPANPRSTLLHEMQHAVQAREGFPRGAAPNDAELKATLRSEQTALKAQAAERLIPLQEHRASIIRPLIEGGMTPGQARAEYARQFPEMDADFNKLWAAETGDGRFTGQAGYNRVAGEVEARDVQSRADFAPDQRAATAPYTSQGIAPEDMIVLNRGGGVQASAELPMDEASRLARAEGDLSLDTAEPLYHGTASSFDRFRLGRVSDSTHTAHETPAVFLTNAPDLAGEYAASAAKQRRERIAEIYARHNKDAPSTAGATGDDASRFREMAIDAVPDDHPFKDVVRTMLRTADGQGVDLAALEKVSPEAAHFLNLSRSGASFVDPGANIIPVYASKNLLDVDSKMFGGNFNPAIYDQMLARAKEGGYDGVRFRQVVDSPSGMGDPSDVIAMLKPSRMRSIFAKMDPAQRGSANLSAALGPLLAVMGIGAGAMGVDAPAEQ